MPNTTAKAFNHRAAKLIQSADALISAAGAGIGVDSGLTDFRGNQGFWQAYPALAQARLDFTEVANPQAFIEPGFSRRKNFWAQSWPEIRPDLIASTAHQTNNVSSSEEPSSRTSFCPIA